MQYKRNNQEDFISFCSNLGNTIYTNYCVPLFTNDFTGPPFWPVIVVSILLFLAFTEIGSQDCSEGQCNHYYDYTQEIDDKDKASTMIDKTINYIRLNHTLVNWRRSLFVSIILSLFLGFITYRGLPPGFIFFIVTTIIFTIMYFSDAWLQSHWWGMIDNKIETSLKELRHNIYEEELINNSEEYKYNDKEEDIFSSEFFSSQ